MSRLFTTTALAVSTLALLASACGSDAGADESSGVATLADTTAAAETATESAATELSADEAALEFSTCIRDQGIDFPDIGVDADGNPELRDAFVEAGVDPRDETFQTAMQSCVDILASAGFGGGGRAALAENAEFQDALVDFSECVRDAGYDVGDLTFGGPPQGDGAGDGPQVGTDGGDPPPRGERQDGFGDRAARIADQLGLDIDDPDVAATIDDCMPVIDTALANAGVGAPGGRP